MGTDLRLQRLTSRNLGNSSGQYVFRTQWTRGPLDNSTAAPFGQDFASFMLGLPTDGSFDLNAFQTSQAGYYSFFFQDDYRVISTLTLNLGIRYEGDLPTTERFNRTVNGFDFSAASPISQQAAAAYARNPIPEISVSQFRTNGGLLFPGPGNRDIYETNATYFSPRLGFAWQPNVWGRKTVFRGGAGVFFFPIGEAGVNQIGFSQRTTFVPTLNSFLTPAATLSNPFPSGIEPPTGSNLGLATNLGRDVSFASPHPKNPYSIRWNLDIQRELPGNVVFEIGYMGNHAVHLLVERNWDFIPQQFQSRQPFRDQPTIDRLTANVPNPFAGLLPGTTLNGSTVQRQTLLGAFPHFTQVTEEGLNDGSSYFHMMQIRVEKRFSRGLQFLGNYQYSKLLQKRTRLNSSDPFMHKRIANEDRPQRFVFSASYDLPFGRGKAFGAGAGGTLNKVIGGWIINGIYTVQPGAPTGDWGNVIYFGGDLRWDPRNIDNTFDTTRFNTNSAQQLGSNIRTFPQRFANLRNDGANNVDFSVIKDTLLTERVKIQFRCEFFNFLNHPSFNGPNLTPTNSNFGKITGQANLPRITQMALRLVW